MVRLPVDQVEHARDVMSGAHACVTGGCGFIGSHLVDALLGVGLSVTVIDDLSNSSVEHLAGLIDLEPDRVQFVHGSILDDAALGDAIEGADYVFHLAAMGSVPRSVEEPVRTWRVNADGTLRVLEHARRARVRRLVYSASSSAYGESGDGAKVESAAPAPRSPYAASKLAGEELCRAWSSSYGISTVCLRYFNIFGARQPADSSYAAVIPAFTRAIADGRRPVVFGDGHQTRDFTHVCNAVSANLLAAAADTALAGESVNVGTGERTSLLALLEALGAKLGRAVDPDLQPARTGDVRDSLAELTRAKGLLGYAPVIGLNDGLDEVIEWMTDASATTARAEPRSEHPGQASPDQAGGDG